MLVEIYCNLSDRDSLSTTESGAGSKVSLVRRFHNNYILFFPVGIVPSSGKVDVMVTFAPTEFNTAVMKLKLELTQFNFSPLLCTFSGSSLPGLDM